MAMRGVFGWGLGLWFPLGAWLVFRIVCREETINDE
jgi:hypothetical protein